MPLRAEDFHLCLNSLLHLASLRQNLSHTPRGANNPTFISLLAHKITLLKHYAGDNKRCTNTSTFTTIISLLNRLSETHNQSGSVEYEVAEPLDELLEELIGRWLHTTEAREADLDILLDLRAKMGGGGLCRLSALCLDQEIQKMLEKKEKKEKLLTEKLIPETGIRE